MSHLPLDARAILDYLNELGYRNISGEQLKEFMKDLRKLIKYEESLGVKANVDNYFENLFKRTTASFRAKYGKENERGQRSIEVKTKREREKHVLRPLNQFESQQQQANGSGDTMANRAALNPPAKPTARGGENLAKGGDRLPLGECNKVAKGRQQSTNEHASSTSKKGGSSIEQNTKRGGGQAAREQGRINNERAVKGAKPQSGAMARDENMQRNQMGATTTKDASSRTGRTRDRAPSHERRDGGRSPSGDGYATARSKGVIIPRYCTVTRRRRPLSTDPVALYHYYQSEWNHFREQIPGENTHSELRWMIRTRLMDPNCKNI